MRAAFYDRMGPARAVLTVGELAMPEPGHGEVLIKVEASGVNPHDTKRRSGWLGSTMYATRVIPIAMQRAWSPVSASARAA